MALKESFTRKEFAQFCWKVGRAARQLVKPDFSPERGMLWHECKGVLKQVAMAIGHGSGAESGQVLVIEKFQPGVFTDAQVRKDVLETQLIETLEKLISYLRRRWK